LPKCPASAVERFRLGCAFGMPDAPSLMSRVLLKSTLAVTELRCDQPDFGKSAPVVCEDAYLIVLHLHACSESLYFEGRLKQRESHSGGTTSIYDLRRSPVTDIHDLYHSLVFYLPRTALDTMSSEAGVQRIGDLRHRLGASMDDPVVRHLLSSLVPADERQLAGRNSTEPCGEGVRLVRSDEI
jgi:AraC family transcriptional regulator